MNILICLIFNMQDSQKQLTKEERIKEFDPNGPGRQGNLFGLPFDKETSELIIIPVPWEVTVSYGAGTADGPEAILEASTQVDLFVRDIPDAWTLGLTMLPVSEGIKEQNAKYRDLASSYIRWLEDLEGKMDSSSMQVIPRAINDVCEKLHIYVKSEAMKYLAKGKMVALLGGDHSTPLGLIRALAEHHDDFGILQLDAHLDLRNSYENFTYSHASIMFNVLQIPQISRLVQVGIRDYCEEEVQVISASGGRVQVFYDQDIQNHLLEGNSWKTVCNAIIKALPEKVYISFDIDGLDPRFCPNTGTPVPGGMDYQQVMYLFRALLKAGKEIIGFDLVEVSPGDGEWDANVGARLLYQMSNYMAVSQGKLPAIQ
jgi:agmatinase